MLSSSQTIHTRRQFLLRSSVASLSAFAPALLSAQPANIQLGSGAIPKDTLLKFNPDGGVRRFAGNTIICHLTLQTRLLDTVIALGHALRSSPFSSKLAGLPDDSYHVTILGGPNDQDRTAYGWPSDIPLDASMEQCNQIISKRIQEFRSRTELPLRFRLNREKTLAPQLACGLQLVPASAEEERKIRALRDRMSADVFRYRAANHDSFGFHISMAYQLGGFNSDEMRKYRSLLAEHVQKIAETTPIIELGVPEFCTFEDMYRFEVQTLLRT